MLQKTLHFQVEAVAGAGPEPAIPVTVRTLRADLRKPKVEFYRQFQVEVALSFAAVVEAVEFAQGAGAVAHWQVVRHQLDALILLQEEMPERLEIQSQPGPLQFFQVVQQRSGLPVQGFQPTLPWAVQDQSAVGHVQVCRGDVRAQDKGRGEARPGQIAHCGRR